MIDWPCIEGFVGYGRADAPVVFIGPEEHLDSTAGLMAELELRSTYNKYMDRLDAQGTGADKFLLGKFVPTWKPMDDLMLRRKGCAKPTYHMRRQYQVDSLGRRNGDTLIAELLPYPSPSRRDWVYTGVSRFRDRETYEETVTGQRITALRQVLVSHPRELVICYGKYDWPSFEALFPAVPAVAWNSIGTRYRTTDFNGSRVVLTWHFSRTFESEAALDELAEVVLGERQTRS